MAKRVLDVGNCGFDHGAIARYVQREFGAQADAAHDAEEALRKAKTGEYAVVLVNRVFDADGGSGLELIQTLKTDPQTQALPVMLITNYANYEAQAIAAGAEPGFGKATLHEPQTRERLGKYLHA
jgi:CheY-like chemotaxis protein